MDEFELTGRSRSLIVDLDDPRVSLHYEAVASYLAMREAAATSRVDLVAVSGFRDFDRQVTLWNRKWRGERPLYNTEGRLLDYLQLDEMQRVQAILCWSAVPGGSRHHWGTDIDVIDAAAMPENYQVQLVPEEYQRGGVFERLTAWLDQHSTRFGFYRPYATDRCATGIEPWHLSYYPVACRALEALTLQVLEQAIATSQMQGKEAVLKQLPDIYQRFICAVDPPRQTASRPSSVQA
jgi:LAS superfamily LD-carboxypeptidase LdcB